MQINMLMLELGFWSRKFEEAENIARTVLLVFRNAFQFFLRVIMLLKNQRKIRAKSTDLDIPMKFRGMSFIIVFVIQRDIFLKHYIIKRDL